MSRSDQESYARNKQAVATAEAHTSRIRELNDGFRTTLVGGRITITAGVKDLGEDAVTAILRAVVAFSAFDADNDPHHEHDFGALTARGERLFWKIDCYDRRLEYGSPDPTDPDVTARVLTVMLAAEY